MRSLRLAVACVASCILVAQAHSKEDTQPWVDLGPTGKLVYRQLPTGDHIMDFSYAGYESGGVPLPAVPVVRTLTPSGNDDTAAIQKAIDDVSSLPIQPNKFRGAILLGPGIYRCSKTITIAASGVVLRGSASQTTLKLIGDPHIGVAILGDVHTRTVGPTLHITQPYVPSGTRTITLDDASTLAPGDTIRITRYTTPKWLHFMSMDKLEHARDGDGEVWVGKLIATDRTIESRSGNTLTVTVPLADSYDRKFLPPEGAEVVKITQRGAIDHDAAEYLHLAAPPVEVGFHDNLFQAARIDAAQDAWMRDITVDDTTEGFEVGEKAARITLQDISIGHTTNVTSAAKPADFALRGTQTLVLRCKATGDDRMYVITGARNQGPNVVLASIFQGDGRIQPHQRWATGFLVDHTLVPGGGIDLMNRGEMGTGHGWTMGWGVVWNSVAADLVIQNPPGAANWAIGTTGRFHGLPMKLRGVHPRDLGPDLPSGYIQSPGHDVLPTSLYLQQLSERLGPKALTALKP